MSKILDVFELREKRRTTDTLEFEPTREYTRLSNYRHTYNRTSESFRVSKFLPTPIRDKMNSRTGILYMKVLLGHNASESRNNINTYGTR